MLDNTLFVLHCLILRQGESGVPIGGFISAQPAELLALLRENQQLQGEVKDRQPFKHSWNQALNKRKPVFPEVQRPNQPERPSLCGCVTGPSNFIVAPTMSSCMQICGRMMRSHTPHLVSLPVLQHEGLQAWWAAVQAMLASLQVNDVPILFLKSTPWDGAPNGRLTVIVEHTPARDKHKVGVHLKVFDVFHSVLDEALRPPDRSMDANLVMPFVLFGRYRDNVYVIYSAIPPMIEPWVDFVVATFIRLK